MNEKYIQITEKEYNDMRDDQTFLRCLEAAGVDGWEGYEEAQEIYES